MTRSAPTQDARDCFGLVGTELESRYRVDRVVAEGGYGVVYAGYDRRLNVPVAIKALKADDALSEARRREFVEQFVHEAQTVARLRHPNIVAVQNVGVAQTPSGVTAPWMALEWLDGHTLQKELSEWPEGRRMSPREALALLRPVFDSVAHAHEEGFAHRDLKPANIMLVPKRRAVVAYVLDFGIAKAFTPDDKPGSGATSTRDTAAGFTATYAAPEQIGGTRTGPWTDVHALGLIFVELLIGKRPYEGRDRTALFTRALAESRPTPARFGVDVGPLEPLLARALALRPDARFANAREFLDALEATIDPMAPLVPRVSDSSELEGPRSASGPREVSVPVAERSLPVAPSAPSRPTGARAGVFGLVTFGVVALALGIFSRERARSTASLREPGASPVRNLAATDVHAPPDEAPTTSVIAAQEQTATSAMWSRGDASPDIVLAIRPSPGPRPRPFRPRRGADPTTAAVSGLAGDAGVPVAPRVPESVEAALSLPDRAMIATDAGLRRSSVDVTNVL